MRLWSSVLAIFVNQVSQILIELHAPAVTFLLLIAMLSLHQPRPPPCPFPPLCPSLCSVSILQCSCLALRKMSVYHSLPCSFSHPINYSSVFISSLYFHFVLIYVKQFCLYKFCCSLIPSKIINILRQ